MTGEISVVVVTYWPGESLATFLNSLESASERAVPVVVVDNGTKDGSLDTAAGRPNVELIVNDENVGYGRAANIGVRHTSTDYVLVANPDITWEVGALDALLAATTRWPDGAAFGPLIRRPDGAVYPSARALPSISSGIGHALLGWWWQSNPWTSRYRAETMELAERSAGWLSGSCVLIRRDAFDAIGGFDPAYFMYFEDLDLGERLTRAGWCNVYVPGAAVTHVGGLSTQLHRREMVHAHHESARRYVRGRYAGWRWWAMRNALELGLAARALLAGRVRRVAEGAAPQRFAPRLEDPSPRHRGRRARSQPALPNGHAARLQPRYARTSTMNWVEPPPQ